MGLFKRIRDEVREENERWEQNKVAQVSFPHVEGLEEGYGDGYRSIYIARAEARYIATAEQLFGDAVVAFEVGNYTVSNALAALAICKQLGLGGSQTPEEQQ